MSFTWAFYLSLTPVNLVSMVTGSLMTEEAPEFLLDPPPPPAHKL